MAKKVNQTPDEIDLTTFEWVNAGSNPDTDKPGCGGCHPGGGGMEFDRDGERYDLRLKETPELANTLDGDYSQSFWDRTGVIEIDCFICHLPGYYYKKRIQQLGVKNFKWATVAATGIGKVSGAVSLGQSPQVEYNRRFFNNDGKIVLKFASPPFSENCNLCHAAADLLKRGFSWNDRKNHDTHNLHGLECANCHPGNPEHQFAKGNENLSTVRDDLDGTMLTCRQCHEKGFMGAPRMEHTSVRPNHLEKFACEVCHIPSLQRASAKGLCVSTGTVRTYPRADALKLGDPVMWKPDFERDTSGRLWPVNAFSASLYTNMDTDGRSYPIFARELKKAFLTVRDRFPDMASNQPLVRSDKDIVTMLLALEKTLRGNQRFEKIQPAYHHEGWRYILDKNNALQREKDTSWAGSEKGFNISHNVAPTREALGGGGCGDCHDRSADLFKNWIAGEHPPADDAATIKKSGLVFGKPLLISYLTEIHDHNHLKAYICPVLFFLIFAGVIRRSSMPHTPGFLYESPSFLSWRRHISQINRLAGGICFLLLAVTGYVFFFNQLFILKLFFKTFESAVVFHCIAGILFLGSLLVGRMPKNTLLDLRGARGKDVVNIPLRAGPSSQVLKLGLVMGITGTLNLVSGYFEADVKYTLSIVHAGCALFFVAFCCAQFYLRIEKGMRQANLI